MYQQRRFSVSADVAGLRVRVSGVSRFGVPSFAVGRFDRGVHEGAVSEAGVQACEHVGTGGIEHAAVGGASGERECLDDVTFAGAVQASNILPVPKILRLPFTVNMPTTLAQQRVRSRPGVSLSRGTQGSAALRGDTHRPPGSACPFRPHGIARFPSRDLRSAPVPRERVPAPTTPFPAQAPRSNKSRVGIEPR